VDYAHSCIAIDVPQPDVLTKVENIRTFIDSLDHYLINKRGIDRVPLAYFVRKDIDPPDADDNPEGYGEPTLADKLMYRAKHDGNPAYLTSRQSDPMVSHSQAHNGRFCLELGFFFLPLLPERLPAPRTVVKHICS
jgi:hypothetical protein